MEFATIVTVKQAAFDALVRSVRLYMEQDYCVCQAQPGLLEDQACPPACDGCTWCVARMALRSVGQLVDA